MQFPSEWSHKLHKVPQASLCQAVQTVQELQASSKRRKVSTGKEELKLLLSQCDEQQALEASQYANPDYDDTIVGLIKRQVNNTRFAPATPEELQLDHVLSSVPYRDMLESLFGTVSGQTPNLPVITKAFEESFMREACTGELQCAMGAKCECMFIDANAPFIGVEFKLLNLPSQLDLDAASPTTSPTTSPTLCVLCSRKTTQKLFYDACYSGARIQGLIQRYGNLCNQPGEYARDCMLICPPSAQWHCLPLPIMSHQRNRYRVQVVAGIKHLQQLRVSHEDFFVTPSGRRAV